MRSSVKPANYSTLEQLGKGVREFGKEQYRNQETFRLIVNSAFGSRDCRGLIPTRIQYYYSKTPINWAEEIEALARIFSPEGEIMTGQTHKGLIVTSDALVSIDPKILPRSVMDEFAGTGDKHSTMLRNLKREMGDKYYINSWEWFWCSLAHALANQPEIDEKRSLAEDQQEDELFFMLSRNPYLIIARKALQHSYRKDSYLLERMRGVFELYFIEDLLTATRKREGRSSEGKYQLRSHHLGMMFLLIHSRRGRLTGETMEIYQEYFLKATEYYSTITTQANTHNVRYLLRIWVYLLTRDHSLDSTIVKQIENANPKDGWYRLSRCPLEQWIKSVKKTEFLSFELPPLINIRRNFFRLLGKQGEWTPNSSFLATLEQFIEFDEVVLSKYIKRQTEHEDDEVLARCFERILVHLAETGASCPDLEVTQGRINEKYRSKLPKKLSINFAERSEQAKQKLSRSSRQKSKTISYQSPRMRNVWEHPLQQNEFYLFFQIAFWLSRQMDRVIPGHSKRTYPCLNIRILSNPIVFFLLLFCLMYALKALLEQ